MKVLALVPARAGSKRIKNKNIKKLNGKPLICYVIDELKKSKLVDKVVVSTDSKQIANIAKKNGAEVPFIRPKKISGDKSLVIDTVTYNLDRFKKENEYVPDYVLLVQPVNPFISSKQIDSAIRLAYSKKADSVVSVVEVDTTSHPFNIRVVSGKGTVRFWKGREHYNFLGKEKQKFYRLGNLIISSYDTIKKEGRLEGKKNYFIEIDKISGIDIDDLEDFLIAESIMISKQIKK